MEWIPSTAPVLGAVTVSLSVTAPSTGAVEGWLPGAGERGKRELCLMGTELQFEMMKKF